MTVKTLNTPQKGLIREMYINKSMNISELAQEFHVSTRTIGRVLREMDLATPHQIMRGEAYLVMQLLRKYNISPKDLEMELRPNSPVVAKTKAVNLIIDMPDAEYAHALAHIVSMREAKKQNVHVQTAMLNLQEKAAKNERDTKEGNI